MWFNIWFQPFTVQMLAKKVDTLTKAMEVEAKKMRREVAAMEKEVTAIRVEKEQDNRAKRLASSKTTANSSQINPVRYTLNYTSVCCHQLQEFGIKALLVLSLF